MAQGRGGSERGESGRARLARARGGLAAAVVTLLGCAGAAGPGASPVVAVTLCADGQSLASGRCVAAPVASASGPAGSAVASAAPLRRPAMIATPGREGLGPLVGRWLGEDSSGEAFYHLTILGDGRFEQEIETRPGASGRSPGSCLQTGRARVEEEQLFWYFEQNTCNTEYEGREDPDRIAEQGARSFTLDINGSYQVTYARP